MYRMNLSKWISEEAYHLIHNFGGGPLLMVTVESEWGWVLHHAPLYRFIETCVKERLDEIEAFIQERYKHFDPSEEYCRARAETSLHLPKERTHFQVVITLTTSIPYEDRESICASIARLVEDKFEPSVLTQ